VEAREVLADERRDDKEQRLLRQVAALECEIARYEAHFETLKAQLDDYKRKNRELQDIVCMLKRAMKTTGNWIVSKKTSNRF
jgi:peptidoglycan hydrolase CwlO-like protein